MRSYAIQDDGSRAPHNSHRIQDGDKLEEECAVIFLKPIALHLQLGERVGMTSLALCYEVNFMAAENILLFFC